MPFTLSLSSTICKTIVWQTYLFSFSSICQHSSVQGAIDFNGMFELFRASTLELQAKVLGIFFAILSLSSPKWSGSYHAYRHLKQLSRQTNRPIATIASWTVSQEHRMTPKRSRCHAIASLFVRHTLFLMFRPKRHEIRNDVSLDTYHELEKNRSLFSSALTMSALLT